MKKNFMKAMLLTLVVAGMGLFNSCKDTDEDLYNDLRLTMQDKNSKLEDVLKAQAQALEELSQKLAEIKPCECDGKGYQTAEQVIELIKQNSLSAAEVQEMINSAIASGLNEDDVNRIIAAYLASANYITKDEAQALVVEATSTLASQAALNDAISTLNAAIESAKDALTQQVTDLSVTINNVNIAVTEAAAKAEAAQTTANENKTAIENVANKLKAAQVAWGEQLAQVTQKAADAMALAESNKNRVESMETSYRELATKTEAIDKALSHSLDSLAGVMEEFATKEALQDVLTVAGALYDEAMAYTKQVETAHAERLGNLETAYATLEGRLGELEGKVDELDGQVAENTRAISALHNFLNNLVTGIIIQGTQNPVFGSFALPFGIRSNMLIAYYGQTENNVQFPTVRTANFIRKEQALTQKDAEMLGASVESYKVPAGSVMLDDAEGNAGRIYLTVNPNTVNFEGTTLPLVNSRDEESGVKLGALKYSDEKLTFGITRGESNGFYEAPATVTEENLESVKLKKDITGNLKAIAKDVLTPSQIDFTEVASRLYNMFDGMLDANGVKATWTENGKEHNVLSEYKVAATAVKPLSYAFLYDTNLGDELDKRIPDLPQINPITEGILNNIIDLDKINVELNLDLSSLNFTVGDIDIAIPEIEVQFNQITVDDLGEIKAKVEIPTYEIAYDDHGTPYIKEVEGVKQEIEAKAQTEEIRAKIEEAINNAMAEAGQSMGEEIRQQLEAALDEQLSKVVAQIEASVNDLIQNQLAETINGQLNSAVADVLEQVMDQVTSGVGGYVDQANNYIAKVNVWTNKLNNLMDKVYGYINNFNYKLQITALYYGNDGLLHQLSTNRAIPTVYNGTTGAAPLWLTSCSAELLAPAAKKFVGVTNVYKNGESAQDGNADCKAQLDAVNSGEYFNTVLPGNRYGIAMENLKAGYTYEIYYSAVDYQGKISARRFYVAVK